jgi:hypothetical protein
LVGKDIRGRSGNLGNVAVFGKRLRRIAMHIGDGDNLRLRQTKCKRLRMNAPNASRADNSKMQLPRAHCLPINFRKLRFTARPPQAE